MERRHPPVALKIGVLLVVGVFAALFAQGVYGVIWSYAIAGEYAPIYLGLIPPGFFAVGFVAARRRYSKLTAFIYGECAATAAMMLLITIAFSY